MNTLSIAVLNFNGAEYLEECLKSLDGFGTERILIDNSSTDDSWKIADQYNFKVIHADNKYKFLTGLNEALKNSSCDYILFTQADVRFSYGAIHYLYESICQNPLSLIQPVFLKIGQGIDNAGMNLIWPGYGLGITKLKKNVLYETDIATSITFITSRKVIETVGYFDEEFSPAYYEDVDYALRCRKVGIQHYVQPKALVYHRHNAAFSKVYAKSDISDICRKNRKYLIKKHYRGLNRWLRLAVTASLDIVKKTVDIVTSWRVLHN